MRSLDCADAELVGRAADGDQGAFGCLVARHRALALHLSKSVLRDDARADDAVQEALLVAWLNLARLHNAERFGSWLAGIALRVCHRWLRQERMQSWSLDALLGGRMHVEPIDCGPSPQQVIEQAQLAEHVRVAVRQLPAGQRSVVVLFYLAGLSHIEIAELLSIQPGAVKTRLHKARGRLREMLADTWREEYMTTDTSSDFVNVHVQDVCAVRTGGGAGERRLVLLSETHGQRTLPIWIGAFEGDAIAIGLVGAQAARPLTFAFAARLLEAAGGRVNEVRIARLVNETYYAQVVIDSPAGIHVVDSRPSDAIALAIEMGAPIRVAAIVMEEAGKTPAQIEQKLEPQSRSARERSAAIKEHLAQPAARWSDSSLF